jgi:predicted Ser/Thr protein kinase
MTQSKKNIHEVFTFDVNEYVKNKGSKSSAIRALHAQGYSRGQIADLLKIRYQHVRNVLITPVKKG